MLFQRKGWLRKQFDEKLLTQLNKLKLEWNQQKNIVEKSFDPSEDIICQSKLSEAKYFFLLKEAKTREVSIKTKTK